MNTLDHVARRAKIVELDKRYLWHPYTPMDRYVRETEPLVIERAQGAELFDVNGRRYLDGNASWWTSLLGHNHPRLVEALKRQSERLCHTSLAGVTHEPAAHLAAELCDVAPPGLEHVFYTDNGSSAIELALKMCLQYWQQNGAPERHLVVGLNRAFHGETLGATAVSGVEVFRKPFQGALMESVFVEPTVAADTGRFEELERLFEQRGSEIAAVVMEPRLQGAGGMRVYPAEVLREARRITQEHGALLIIDEVFTGYGRTGPMWAVETAGVAPDLLCVGKGFCGGILPMAATLATSQLYDGFLGADERALFYGHTFCGHPLGAAVAREVLAIYREEGVLFEAEQKAARIKEAVESWQRLPGVEDGRALGMMGAVRVDGASGYLERSGWSVCERALAQGVYLRPLGDVVYLTPPINIDSEQLDELLEVIGASLTAAAG